VFAQCRTCHFTQAEAGHGNGPNLHRIFGKVAGKQPGFEYYSAPLQAAQFVWTPALLYAWLENPMAATPGTSMMSAGVPDPARRADLIYLEQVSVRTARTRSLNSDRFPVPATRPRSGVLAPARPPSFPQSVGLKGRSPPSFGVRLLCSARTCGPLRIEREKRSENISVRLNAVNQHRVTVQCLYGLNFQRRGAGLARGT
jgi:cytochrome c